MLEESLSLRIASIFIVAAASFIGAYIPIFIHARDGDIQKNRGYRVLKATAAGIITGVGFLHTMPEAAEMLASVPDEGVAGYPLCFALTMFGAFILLGLEQVVFHMLKRDNTPKVDSPSAPLEPKAGVVAVELPAIGSGEETTRGSLSHSIGHSHGHGFANILNDDNTLDLVRAYGMEFGVAGNPHSS